MLALLVVVVEPSADVEKDHEDNHEDEEDGARVDANRHDSEPSQCS